MLGAVSRLIAAMLPGALPYDSICGRSNRSGWIILESWIDWFMGEGHCLEEHIFENKIRDLK